MPTTPQSPNKARALEGAIVAALLVLEPVLQPYLLKMQQGTILQVVLAAVIVATIAFIKSLGQSGVGDTTGLVDQLTQLEEKVVAAGSTAQIARSDARATTVKLNEVISSLDAGK